MFRIPLPAALAAMLVVQACSDGNSNEAPDGGDAPAPRPDAASSGPDSTSDAKVAPEASSETGPVEDATPHDAGTTDAGPLPDSALVLNEISGRGTDYVEIFNGGTTSLDIGSWGVTDEDHEAGTPEIKHAVYFPAGTMLPPNGYALVNGAPKDGGEDMEACPASTCLQATWNISDSKGENIYLLDSAHSVFEEGSFPKETVGKGQSWGRLPNGTGSFSLNTMTPGKANEGP